MLKKIVDKNHIRLICVQYPLRRLVDLEDNFTDKGNIVFVGNEDNFKNAVEKNGYDYYFVDAWGGDSGHCTVKGNALLAENIATVINNYFFGENNKQ